MVSLVLGGLNTRVFNTNYECPLIVGNWVTNNMENIGIRVSHIIKYASQMGKRVNYNQGRQQALRGAITITCTIINVTFTWFFMF
jgi:hypothetical protein